MTLSVTVLYGLIALHQSRLQVKCDPKVKFIFLGDMIKAKTLPETKLVYGNFSSTVPFRLEETYWYCPSGLGTAASPRIVFSILHTQAHTHTHTHTHTHVCVCARACVCVCKRVCCQGENSKMQSY
jgi:hypothetical protein